MGKLEGKVAVITGGNSGIGLATAKEFKKQGARIVISGRQQQTLDKATQEIGGDVMAVRADTSSLPEIDKLFAAVKEKFGSIDVLFVNAGIGKFSPLENVTEELFDKIMDIMIGGPTGAAARLGLNRTTLNHRMRKLGITRPQPQS